MKILKKPNENKLLSCTTNKLIKGSEGVPLTVDSQTFSYAKQRSNSGASQASANYYIYRSDVHKLVKIKHAYKFDVTQTTFTPIELADGSYSGYRNMNQNGSNIQCSSFVISTSNGKKYIDITGTYTGLFLGYEPSSTNLYIIELDNNEYCLEDNIFGIDLGDRGFYSRTVRTLFTSTETTFATPVTFSGMWSVGQCTYVNNKLILQLGMNGLIHN